MAAYQRTALTSPASLVGAPLLLSIALVAYALHAPYFVLSFLTLAAYGLLLFCDPLAIRGGRIARSAGTLSVLALLFFVLGRYRGGDDSYSIGHWLMASRIFAGDNPPSNCLLPGLPLTYHWGFDALAAFLHGPLDLLFSNGASWELTYALTETALLFLQLALFKASIHALAEELSIPAGSFLRKAAAWLLSLLCVCGTQWLPLDRLSPVNYAWPYFVGPYRMPDALLGFQTQQRAFVLGTCLLLAFLASFDSWVKRLEAPTPPSWPESWKPLVPGTLLAALYVGHFVIFGMTGLGGGLFVLAWTYQRARREGRFPLRSGVFATLPLVLGLAGPALFVGILSGSGHLGSVVHFPDVPLYPRARTIDPWHFILFWIRWWGLPALACAGALAWQTTAARPSATSGAWFRPLRSARLLQLALISACSFVVLFLIEHEFKWDEAKFLIVGTIAALPILSVGCLAALGSPSRTVRAAILASLLLSLIPVTQQVLHLARLNPLGNLVEAVQAPFPLCRDREGSKDAPTCASPEDRLHLISKAFSSEVEVTHAVRLGVRPALNFDLEAFPIDRALIHRYREGLAGIQRLDEAALREWQVRFIAVDERDERAWDARLEQLGYRKGPLSAGFRYWYRART